ncbi:hypothetical protein [Streptomyces caeruleatus]|nr:hypothetical protein [Streptomyces caeruleatus]
MVPLTKVWESETDDGSFRLHWWEEFLSLAPVFDGDQELFERIPPDL